MELKLKFSKKENLIATLVKINDSGRQKAYKLNHILTKGVCALTGKIIDVNRELIKTDFREEFKQYVKDGYDVIIVSDANSHTERLVFAGIEYYKNGEHEYGRSRVVVGGKNTFMISGGDPKTIHSVEVYVRRLAQINGLEYGGVNEDLK